MNAARDSGGRSSEFIFSDGKAGSSEATPASSVRCRELREVENLYFLTASLVRGKNSAQPLMPANRKLPGPKISLPTFLGIYFDPLRTLTRAVRQYGDVVHLKTFGRHNFLLNHPDYIRAVLLDQDHQLRRSVHPPLKKFLGRGLLSSEGRFHQRQRRMIQPAFHKDRIAAFGETMTRETERLSDRRRDGATVDLRDEMLHLTMGIVGKTLFNVDVH